MLEYVKTILLKVSFDRKLFEKELRKALRVLVGEEQVKLKQWCYEKFSDKYLSILDSAFGNGAKKSTI